MHTFATRTHEQMSRSLVNQMLKMPARAVHMHDAGLTHAGPLLSMHPGAQDVGPSENSTLFSTLWTTGQAVSILMMGRLSDRFGRRPFVIITHILGLIGAIVGCTATNFNALLAAMTMLGVAAGPYLFGAGSC